MLIARDLTAGYGGNAVLHRVSFVAPPGMITAILGPGGAGKTTLANAVSGMIPVSTGELTFEGAPIANAALRERTRRGISCMPSGLRLFASLTVLENFRLGGADDNQLRFALSLFPEIQASLPLPASTVPANLHRLIMFARAAMTTPRLLVLDQPSFGLCGDDVHRVFRAISRMCREFGTAVLLLEEKIFQALKLADSAWLLEKGRIVGERSPVELLADRKLQADFMAGGWHPLLAQEAT